jgi:hypothetical protein
LTLTSLPSSAVVKQLLRAFSTPCNKFFSFSTNKCTFYFRISVQFTLHMFRPWLSHHHGTLISSLHCSLVQLVLSQSVTQSQTRNNTTTTTEYRRQQLYKTKCHQFQQFFYNFHNFNNFNNLQQHSALYSQFTVLHFTLLTQDKYFIQRDISRNSLKKFCIPVIVNVNIASNSVTVVIIPNGPVNSEVKLSTYRDDGRVTAETCVGWIEQK